MRQEYTVLFESAKENNVNTAKNPKKVENLEKRMNDIKRKKVSNISDKTWINKSRLSSKIYDNWYSPLNDITLKLDSTYSQLSHCDYQGLVDLLFTSGELDTDKVICLHVLASHPCDKLTLPANTSAKFETQSALDKLLERSKSFCGYRSGIKYNLPIYILNINDAKRQYLLNKYGKKYITESRFEDGRLATRLVINETLWRLVQTVIEALHHCNPSKMVFLLKAAHNVNYVRHVMCKPQIQAFIKALSSENIVLSSDSFLLTRPFESSTEIKIDSPSHNLESLIQNIRIRVLNDANYDNQQFIDNQSSLLHKKYDDSKLRGLNRDTDICLNFCNFDAEKISTILNAKIREAQERDMKKIRHPVTESSNDEECPCPPNARKHHCYACSEKWRNNMLSDEKLSKKSAKFLDNYKPCYSHGTQWLKLMIQEEENNLTKQKTKKYIPKFRRQNDQLVQKRPMILNINEKKKFTKISDTLSHEHTHPNSRYAENNLNLAKIKNEISIKENKRRIKKFLDEPIYAKKKFIDDSDYNIIPI